MDTKISNLLIVSHVLHYEYRGRVYAYGPYTREIDIWADLVPEIRIASPLCAEEPPKDCLPFTRANIRLVPQRRTGGDTYAAKAVQILKLPLLITDLCRVMLRSDAIHVRCPGNLGLLGAILAPLFSPRIIAKYAGQWNGYHSEPLSVRLQRRILSSWWWRRGLVTVYGEWPGQPRQVIPFFTSMMTSSQVRDSAVVAVRKSLSTPARILFSGRLASLKAVDVLLRALAILARQNIPFELSVVGDGPERRNLERLAGELRIDAQVAFRGAIPFDQAMLCYERAHFLVLPSRHSEGWPKVLAEAMCHGVVCVASDHGLIPWMLQDRGLVFPVDDAEALAASLITLINDPAQYRALSLSSAQWAQRYSLEGLRSAIATLLTTRWKVAMNDPRQHAPEPAVTPVH